MTAMHDSWAEAPFPLRLGAQPLGLRLLEAAWQQRRTPRLERILREALEAHQIDPAPRLAPGVEDLVTAGPARRERAHRIAAARLCAPALDRLILRPEIEAAAAWLGDVGPLDAVTGWSGHVGADPATLAAVGQHAEAAWRTSLPQPSVAWLVLRFGDMAPVEDPVAATVFAEAVRDA